MSEFGGFMDLKHQACTVGWLACDLVAAGFPGEKQPKFPMGEFPLGQFSCKKWKKTEKKVETRKQKKNIYYLWCSDGSCTGDCQPGPIDRERGS